MNNNIPLPQIRPVKKGDPMKYGPKSILPVQTSKERSIGPPKSLDPVKNSKRVWL